VHDKQVRRRRAVLALLVCASLILLTAYFGRSSSGPLHSAQRVIGEVFTPIQSGASKVLSPFRDIAGWVSSTVNAKSQNARLVRENRLLRAELSSALYAETQNKRLSALIKLDQTSGLQSYDPVAANVISYDPSIWYQQVKVDRGFDDGVRAGDPVVGNDGLVGEVSSVGVNYAIVRELTNVKFGAGAEIVPGGYSGVLEPEAGNPDGLLLTYVPTSAAGTIKAGDVVVTDGFVDPHDPAVSSRFPAGIPIGQVAANYNVNGLINNQQVPVTPIVNLRNLSVVQILTRPHASGTEQASVAGP
jgi:rod shape-determining protein MreC